MVSLIPFVGPCLDPLPPRPLPWPLPLPLLTPLLLCLPEAIPAAKGVARSFAGESDTRDWLAAECCSALPGLMRPFKGYTSSQASCKAACKAMIDEATALYSPCLYRVR